METQHGIDAVIQQCSERIKVKCFIDLMARRKIEIQQCYVLYCNTDVSVHIVYNVVCTETDHFLFCVLAVAYKQCNGFTPETYFYEFYAFSNATDNFFISNNDLQNLLQYVSASDRLAWNAPVILGNTNARYMFTCTSIFVVQVMSKEKWNLTRIF